MNRKHWYIGVLMSLWGVVLAVDQRITVPVDERGERHIVVVIASYNNENYFRQNLASVFNQNYRNYHVIYIDDCSTDQTYRLVKSYIAQNNTEKRIVLLHNEERKGALCNQYNVIHRCKDTDIVIILDGDDWLIDNQVLSFINEVYRNPNVWFTYGQFIQFPTNHAGWCALIPADVVRSNGFREYIHTPSHLRTFYAGLFKQIKKEDLLYNNDFFRMTGDKASIFPMIEMAREGHFQFISKVLMVYNIGNPLNDHKVVEGLQYQLDLEIRKRRKYEPIATPFLSTEGGIDLVASAA